MILKGNILNDSFEFQKGEVHIENNIIKDIVFNDNITDDCYIVPGFIDTHMHGAMGDEFFNCDFENSKKIMEFEAQNGTTSLIPAISAAPKEKLLECAAFMKDLCECDIDNHAKIYGIHMEGPFFAPEFKGAHALSNIRNSNVDEFKEIFEKCGGYLKIMTIAPELPGSKETIEYAVKNGVVMSLGHTNATFDDIEKGVKWGVSRATHLFNAMSPLHHREPGTVGGALYHDKIKCEVICDFFHVRPEVIKLIYKIKGSDGIIMITDSVSGTGLPDGEYTLSGRVFTVKNGESRFPDGTICGGSTCLIDGIKNLASIGIPLNECIKTATKNPAEDAGIYDKVGSITKGKIADIVVLSKNLDIKEIVLRGKVIKEG